MQIVVLLIDNTVGCGVGLIALVAVLFAVIAKMSGGNR